MGDSTFLTALGADPYEGFGNVQDANPSQTTVLLQKKKEMQALQRQVNKKHYECEYRLSVVKEREIMLGQKQTKIQEAIKRFDKFIQENDIKRNKAARKEKEERQERLIKEEEAAALSAQLRDLQDARAKQKKELHQGKVYERYLETVVESSGGDFDEIEDALMRYATLKGTADDLGAMGDKLNAEIEDLKTAGMQHKKELEDALLMTTSSIAKKQKEMENLRNTAMLLEQRLATQEESANQQISTMGEARRAITNIYLRCRKPNHPMLNPETEVTKALEYIKLRIIDLGRVAARKSEAPEKKVDVPQKKKAAKKKTEEAQGPVLKRIESSSSATAPSSTDDGEHTNANQGLPEIIEEDEEHFFLTQGEDGKVAEPKSDKHVTIAAENRPPTE